MTHPNTSDRPGLAPEHHSTRARLHRLYRSSAGTGLTYGGIALGLLITLSVIATAGG